MSIAGVRQQVLAMLESNGLRCSERDNEYGIRFSSALLFLGFVEIGTQTLITLRAPVLRGVPVGPEGVEELLRELNRLNCESHFGKWTVYEDAALIALEYDLLGDNLQENELMTALAMVARLADKHDDLLQDKFGGLRAFED